MDDLTPKQLKLLKAMLICPTFEEAYRQSGIAKKTALKYRNNPAFKQAYRQAKRDAMDLVTTQLQQSAMEAVRVLKDVMTNEDTPPATRVQSARSILDNAYKGIELEDMAERLEEVEAFMEDRY